MIFTGPENKILNQIELVRKNYDMLDSYRLYHSNIFEIGLDYIPIQYLTNNTFGFSFRVVKGDFYMQIAYSNKNRKFYKNDVITFEFSNNKELTFKLLSGTIKDFHGLNSSIILIKPEQVKLFLFENLESVTIKSKRNEIEFISSHLQNTLEYYNISKSFYQNTVKYITEDLLKVYLKDWPGNKYSQILEY
ncbi:hypothetical protein MG290_01965 [Flavobacterium sp. CBA20B-1]|uniref:hypothetical protein n=1 Tax=unclassified Flavobacterium TaxID=196869 RepID=UPI0022246BBE|nr:MULTISPECIES: hypothetical protein [unclassified Flavobacterium]WCM42461.1 hypothetical protein MG290_01965 [Flavobacterium sp. CBA20B-1]